MDTFTDLYKRTADFCGIDRDNIPKTLLSYFKRDINRGIQKVFTTSRVGYTQVTRKSNLVGGQQYYQLPPDCIRPTTVQVVGAGVYATLPLTEVPTISQWNNINVWPQLSFPWPTFYFVRGHSQIGLWPTPGTDVNEGLIVTYEATPPELGIDDIDSNHNVYTAANSSTPVTANVSNGSTSVTFSQPIINIPNNNLYFMTTDGTDGHSYNIARINDASSITLGQGFQLPGNTSTTAQFRIGQTEDLPDMVALAGSYYAAAQFYGTRKDAATQQGYLAQFQQCLDDFRQSYSTRSTSRTASNPMLNGMNSWEFMGISPVSPGY